MNAIGIFDSGFGGLTVFQSIDKELPGYDYIYLGDNARAPYGNRSYETVYAYTLQCVKWFFEQGCPLVILACNTASAKALRSIQQLDLPNVSAEGRVLGVIRPSAEYIGLESKSGTVGILGTNGTVNSGSYLQEIHKFYPDLKVYQHACPLWVPFIENGDYEGEEVDAVIRKDVRALLDKDPAIDTVLLACTHYPLLEPRIRKYLPEGVRLVEQGPIVADRLRDYLARHPEIERRLSRNGTRAFYTTDDVDDFEAHATTFFGHPVRARHTVLKN